MRQSADGFVHHQTAVVQNFLELSRGLGALMRRSIRLSSPAAMGSIGPAKTET